jgi:4-alpha-glucanotransferase
MLPPGLRRLAEQLGVLTTFDGADGRSHQANEDSVRAVLAALGTPVASEQDTGAALQALRDERSRRVLEPVVAVRQAEPTVVPVNLPDDVDSEQCWISFEMENGQLARHRMSAVYIPPGPGRSGRLDLRLIEGLEPGDHGLVLETPHQVFQARMFVAPSCPAPGRSWGAFMPIHALRSDDDWGIGSYTALGELASWVRELGGGFVGSLPLYPVADGAPMDPSPYLPLSRLAYNELFIDVTVVPELLAAPEARQHLHSGHLADRLRELRSAALVDYDEVGRIKRDLLRELCLALVSRPSSRRDQFDTFAKERPELEAYARFRAVREAGERGSSDVTYHLYTQWVASEQLALAAQAGCSLYADLPVGVRADGFDHEWAPDAFVPGMQGGAPPDAFFEAGQVWGFRPLHPERMRKDGYRYLAECLRRACRHADILRIDHAAGLHRLYWIPDGMDGSQGVYVRYRADELHALVCLEARRSGTVVVGEDLGTVPPEVRRAMGKDGMLRSWVMQFESTADKPFPDPPPRSLASWSTHDLPRFATFFANGAHEGDKPAERAEHERWRDGILDRTPKGQQTREGALRTCLAHLAGGPADLVLVDLEEFWGEEQPQNRPGTGPEAANWRRRAPVSLAEMRNDTPRGRFLASLTDLRAAGSGDVPLEVVAP